MFQIVTVLSYFVEYPKGRVVRSLNNRLLVYTILNSFSSILLYSVLFVAKREILRGFVIVIQCLVFATTISFMVEKLIRSEFVLLSNEKPLTLQTCRCDLVKYAYDFGPLETNFVMYPSSGTISFVNSPK